MPTFDFARRPVYAIWLKGPGFAAMERSTPGRWTSGTKAVPRELRKLHLILTQAVHGFSAEAVVKSATPWHPHLIPKPAQSLHPSEDASHISYNAM